MTVTLHTNHGEPFTVDAEDAPLLDRFTWTRSQSRVRGKTIVFGVIAAVGIGGRRVSIDLRKLIMGPPPEHGLRPHSIDGDLLHLEKANLAWLDVSTSNHRTANVKCRYGYRGVCPDAHSQKTWGFAIGTSARGWKYTSPEEAAIAYDEAVRQRYGRWAIVNFPKSDDPAPTGLVFPPVEGHLQAKDGNAILVDPEHLPVLSRHIWHPSSGGYWAKIGRAQLQLAYLVLGATGNGCHAEPGWRDGDPCNCLRENLCWHYSGISHFRGVQPSGTKWLAKIKVDSQTHLLGRFDTTEEAARAYDKAAREMLGSRARLNFPEHHTQSV